MPPAPISRSDALAWLVAHLPPLQAEHLPLSKAQGRLLAETIRPNPPALRAAIDGHAVIAAATEGATDYAPLPIRSTPIVAGAALPPDTDAILPLLAFDTGGALAAIPPGNGLATPDPVPIPLGTRLTPLHLAALAERGHLTPLVVRRPCVALRVPGPKSSPTDALTPLLTALLQAAGADVSPDLGPVRDQVNVGQTLSTCFHGSFVRVPTHVSADAALPPDLIILAGRSGPGPDDTAAAAFTHLAAHGILIYPGDTAAIGLVHDTPALLLPGDPLACFLAFHLLAAPVLRNLTQHPDPVSVTARLTRKIVSPLGQEEAVPLHVANGEATPLPLILSAVATADALAIIPAGSEGYPAGATIAICPF